VILKFIYRWFGQTRAVYFSGWEQSEKQLSDLPGTGVNHPATAYLGAAEVLSKSQAELDAIKFETYCKERYDSGGTVHIVKEARARRAGWRG
jgi:hypothetical protein